MLKTGMIIKILTVKKLLGNIIYEIIFFAAFFTSILDAIQRQTLQTDIKHLILIDEFNAFSLKILNQSSLW